MSLHHLFRSTLGLKPYKEVSSNNSDKTSTELTKL